MITELLFKITLILASIVTILASITLVGEHIFKYWLNTCNYYHNACQVLSQYLQVLIRWIHTKFLENMWKTQYSRNWVNDTFEKFSHTTQEFVHVRSLQYIKLMNHIIGLYWHNEVCIADELAFCRDQSQYTYCRLLEWDVFQNDDR